jgi:DNA polymerase I-like protein with 3'-5' exonuclease and polymerase domains
MVVTTAWKVRKVTMVRKAILAIDTETTGLRPYLDDVPFIVSTCDGAGGKSHIRLRVDPFTRQITISSQDRARLDILGRKCRNPNIIKVFHNAAFDVPMLEKIGIAVDPPIEDTMIMSHAHDPMGVHALKPLAVSHLGISMEDEEDLKREVRKARREAKKLRWMFHPVTPRRIEVDYWMPGELYMQGCWDGDGDGEWRDYAVEYAEKDAERTMLLYMMYREAFRKGKGRYARRTCKKEMDLWPIVTEMTRRGVMVRRNTLLGMIGVQRRRVEKIDSMYEGINLNAPAQVAEFLFGSGLGLKPIKYTARTHSPSADSDTLYYYRDHEAVGPIAERSQRMTLWKYLQQYLDAIGVDGAVHTHFNQIGAGTGRLSSSGPNLQNVGKREGKLTQQARRVFGPRIGCIWWGLDYSQIEPRIYAFLAGEEVMLEALVQGRDVYQELADRVRGITGLAVSREQAKAIFLGKMYGEGARKLSLQLGRPEDEASEIIRGYNKAFPASVEFMQKTIRDYRQEGEVWTLDGRRIPLTNPDLAYRGVNYRVQGSAAGLMKMAIIRCARAIEAFDMRVWPVLTVHDELIVETDEGENKGNLHILEDEMASCGRKFGLITPVDTATMRKSWYNAEQ